MGRGYHFVIFIQMSHIYDIISNVTLQSTSYNYTSTKYCLSIKYKLKTILGIDIMHKHKVILGNDVIYIQAQVSTGKRIILIEGKTC